MASVLPPSTQSHLQLPVAISGDQLYRLQALVTHRSPLEDHFKSCQERLTYLAECQAKYKESERVPELESSLRDMIDMQHDTAHIKDAVLAVSQEHRDRRSTIEPSRAIFERTEVSKVNWRDQTDIVKYSKSNAYDDFKRRVFDIEHPDDDFPGIESFFREHNGDDDDIEMTYHTKRSLKCPITMTTFQQPLRSKVCVHVYSKDAILEMLARNRGYVSCPVAGCDKILRNNDLERDRVMERRVREEEEEERQGEELSSEDGNEDVLDIL